MVIPEEGWALKAQGSSQKQVRQMSLRNERESSKGEGEVVLIC